MSLKDTWIDLEDAVQGQPDSGSELSVKPINDIAHAVMDLEKNGIPGGGGTGEAGFSPDVEVVEIDGGHRVTITDKDGENSFDVLDGEDGEPIEVEVVPQGTPAKGYLVDMTLHGELVGSYFVWLPNIGENGNWFIGDTDTGVKAGGAGIDIVYPTETVVTLAPNTVYSFGEVATLNLTLSAPIEGKYSEYIFSFISGATATMLTLPDSIKWVNELTVGANKRYEISIVDGVALWCAVEVSE